MKNTSMKSSGKKPPKMTDAPPLAGGDGTPVALRGLETPVQTYSLYESILLSPTKKNTFPAGILRVCNRTFPGRLRLSFTGSGTDT